MEELRECLKSMTLNSDYVSDILASRIRVHPPMAHTQCVYTSCVMAGQAWYAFKREVRDRCKRSRECGLLGCHSHNLN